MKWLILPLLLLASQQTQATPEQDRQTIRDFYQQIFPHVPFTGYADGVYAFDSDARSSWEAIKEFPPYAFVLEKGQQLFNTPFPNGTYYSDCFQNKGRGIAQNYPFWDEQKQQITTLPSAINDCRIKNQQALLTYGTADIIALQSYIADSSRGKIIHTEIPTSALKAYDAGKTYFYQRRGQLNFSCASCHVDNAGKFLRSELLSPALGHTSHWPAYRLNTGEVNTLHSRFKVCNQLIRAKVDAAQSPALRQLEFFLSYMANGLPLNGPSIRK